MKLLQLQTVLTYLYIIIIYKQVAPVIVNVPPLKTIIFFFLNSHKMAYNEFVSINALCACLYIYIRQLSSAPTLWFIDLTVATCHIQYTFLSLCQLFS